jgi:hypothetical protein
MMTNARIARLVFPLGIIAVLLCAAPNRVAAQNTPTTSPAPDDPANVPDLTGSNPLLFLPTLTLRNDYQNVRSSLWQNVTTLGYAQPVQNGKANVRLNVPFVYNNLSGKDRFGLGDLALKYNFLPVVKMRGPIPVSGVFVGIEGIFDTANRDEFGRGKNILSVEGGVGRFLSGGRIIAPALKYNRSISGSGNRADVNELFLDLYMVKQFGGRTAAVLTIDPQIGVSFANNNHMPALVKVAYQFSPSKPGHNVFIRPAVGVGKWRPYDWSIEVGYAIVGFRR